MILGREKVVVTPDVKELLWSALANLASAPVQERTLTGLSVLLQSQTLKQALKPYCVGGPWGRLLDTEAERIGDADVQAFETEGLIGTGAAAAVLAYAGLQDGVDNHGGQIMRAALVSTLLSVGTEAGSGGDESDLLRAIGRGSSDSLSQTGRQLVGRSLDVQPTLTIRPGFPVRVIVTRDLVLEPYRS